MIPHHQQQESPLPPPLPRELLALIREQARAVRRSCCMMTAYPAARSFIGRKCASDAERARALDELRKEVQQ